MEGSILSAHNTDKITNPCKTALITEKVTRLNRRIDTTCFKTLLNKKFG